jgi:hypothetical protein
MKTPGEYYKEVDGSWRAVLPIQRCNSIGGQFIANLSRHDVVQHENGTITVSPSILVEGVCEDGTKFVWHGYLIKGVWNEC